MFFFIFFRGDEIQFLLQSGVHNIYKVSDKPKNRIYENLIWKVKKILLL